MQHKYLAFIIDCSDPRRAKITITKYLFLSVFLYLQLQKSFFLLLSFFSWRQLSVTFRSLWWHQTRAKWICNHTLNTLKSWLLLWPNRTRRYVKPRGLTIWSRTNNLGFRAFRQTNLFFSRALQWHAVRQNDLTKDFERIRLYLQDYHNVCSDQNTKLFILREKNLLNIWRCYEFFLALVN